MKKILALSLLMILAVVLFIGCKQKPPQQQQAQAPAPKIVAPTTYIVAARTSAVTDSTGQVWGPDTGMYNSGTSANCATTSTVTGTPDPMLYKGARVGTTSQPMVYTIKGLTTGAYQVTLYFAECYFTAAGKRVFNVQMQNTTVFSNVDIYAAKGKNVAYTLSAPANVATDTLTISFLPIAGKNVPLINAIQAAPVGGGQHVATLTWTDNVNPIGSVKYNIYRATGNCAGSPAFTKIASNVQGLKYADASVAAQQGYCYQIKSVGTDGTESLPCQAVYLPGSVTSCNCQ